MYIVVWHGGLEAPDVRFKYSLVEAQALFDAWAKDCPEELTVTLYSVDPNSELCFEIQSHEGEYPF